MSGAPEPSASGAAPLNMDGEFPFTRRDFAAIADIMSDEAGIALSDAKAPLVYARLVKRLRALGMRSFREYCALVATQNGAEERVQMVATLTTNVTRFFREPHHFEHLRKEVPALAKKARAGDRVRIWSAGCSSGEEPYSIALTFLALMPDAAQFDVKILATDLDADVLRTARSGTYSQAAIAPIDPDIRAQFLFPDRRTDAEKSWVVKQEVRQLVTFRELNLIAPWPMKGPFQAIFCRNVVIYFEEDTREAIWRQMAAMLAPGGHLYVGHSERVSSPRTPFAPAGQTIYKLLNSTPAESGRV